MKTLKDVRREYPLARAEIDDYAPFWVAAKYNDIQEGARRNDVFLSGQSPNGMPSKAEEQIAVEVGIRRMFRSVVSMNEPEHTKYRQLTQAWFQPKNLRQLEDGMRILAKCYVAKLAARGGECETTPDRTTRNVCRTGRTNSMALKAALVCMVRHLRRELRHQRLAKFNPLLAWDRKADAKSVHCPQRDDALGQIGRLLDDP
jgi:hypothetical protein